MKRIFLDTNFIIDLLLRDEYKDVSQKFLAEASKAGYSFHISFLTVANFAYIERKLPKEVLTEYLTIIADLFDIVPNTQEQIISALSIDSKDFEDAIQYQTALSANCGCIITRNQKHFSFSKIPVLSAAEFRLG